MLDAVEKGKVDVMITWEPAIGLFLKRHPDLEIVPGPTGRIPRGSELYAFPMAMGVRQNDETLKNRLDAVIAKEHGNLQSILNNAGVKLYAPQTGAGAF